MFDNVALNEWWPLWVAWILQGLFCWYNVWAYRKKMLAQDERFGMPLDNPPRPVAVFAPIKGVDRNFNDFVDGLLDQDYPDYRLIITVESVDDPAYAALRERLGLAGSNHVLEKMEGQWPAGSPRLADGLREVRVHVAGLAEYSSQKVHNQLSALQFLTDRDELLACVDADIHCRGDWLSRLLSPLNHGTHEITTTYRWLIPQKPTLPNLLASAINGSVATLGGPEIWNLTWGGSFALTQETFERLDLRQQWKGCLNDDLQMAYVARRAGVEIAFLRSNMRPTPIWYDWPGMLGFGWRQYFQVRIYAPWAWWVSFVGNLLYAFGFFTAWTSLLLGDALALVPIVLVGLMNQARAVQRRRIVEYIFGREIIDKLKPVFRLDRWATSLGMLVHLLVVLSSIAGNRITWSGIKYRVSSRQKTVVLSRKIV